MVVQHNLTAMNSNRMLSVNTSTQAKTTEKLSSGYRINRAADDAAGLSISEKMRRQIRGLTQASTNAQDGISCVQTAEGALNEVHEMLQRMNELAVKGETGTLASVDRNYIRDEIAQLMSEIDRVQSTTSFNEQTLLDGSFTGKGIQVGAESGQHITISIKSMSMAGLAAATAQTNTTYNIVASTGVSKTSNTSNTSKAGGTSNTNAASSTNATGTVSRTMNSTVATNLIATFQSVSGNVTSTDFASLNAFVKSALQTVSTQRSALGAIQNRLEYTINNLDTTAENMTAANSRIRDTDMANEMVKFSNNNILAQAGQAMLAQANQSNQGVLSLLG